MSLATVTPITAARRRRFIAQLVALIEDLERPWPDRQAARVALQHVLAPGEGLTVVDAESGGSWVEGLPAARVAAR